MWFSIVASPKPYVEVFVHSVAMEGIHLRGGPIARGGLRWSDRQDYRTEVYGLMRAQLTKNAIIVPAGAKGGFIVKRSQIDPTAASPSASGCSGSPGRAGTTTTAR